MDAIADRLANVSLEEGKSAIGLYSLASAVFGLPRGRRCWEYAVITAQNRGIPVPVTRLGRIPSIRKTTPVIYPENVPGAMRVLLCHDKEKYSAFQNDEKARLAVSLLMERAKDQTEEYEASLPSFRLPIYMKNDEGASMNAFVAGLSSLCDQRTPESDASPSSKRRRLWGKQDYKGYSPDWTLRT